MRLYLKTPTEVNLPNNRIKTICYCSCLQELVDRTDISFASSVAFNETLKTRVIQNDLLKVCYHCTYVCILYS